MYSDFDGLASSRRALRPAVFVAAILLASAALSVSGYSQTNASGSNSVVWSQMTMPPGMPGYMAQTWHSVLMSPRPSWTYTTGTKAVLPALEYDYPDPTGLMSEYQPAGPTITASNAFFQSLGTNGRSCATCHAPGSGFGLSLTAIRSLYKRSFGRDPLFDAVDGATCPKNVQQLYTTGSVIGGYMGHGNGSGVSPYYALLNKGLIRIPLPVPANAQYTVSIVSDPYGCNITAPYNQVVNSDGSISQVLSVYRRPLISANLQFKTTTVATDGAFPPIDPLTGAALPVDSNGVVESGNLMWDGREATLSTQASDATLSHAQALTPPTAAQVAQMVAFESGVYSAQIYDYDIGFLGSPYTGGPFYMPAYPAATLPPFVNAPPIMNLYNNLSAFASQPATYQASVYRGQQLFNNRKFVISSVAGFNNIAAIGQNFSGTCGSCHAQTNVGTDAFPVAQHDIGVGGSDWNLGGPLPASDLPVFLFTCTAGNTTPYNTTQVMTNDPGKGLITGQCADLGRMTVPTLRALAARAPYFSDGSAANLAGVVNFYNKRFNIGFSSQDTTDMVNFLNTL